MESQTFAKVASAATTGRVVNLTRSASTMYKDDEAAHQAAHQLAMC